MTPACILSGYFFRTNKISHFSEQIKKLEQELFSFLCLEIFLTATSSQKESLPTIIRKNMND